MGVPIALFASEAVKSFDTVNTALTQLQKVYGEGLTPPSQNSINQISQEVLQLGRNMAATLGTAQEFTVGVATSFAAMGKQGQELLTITEQTDKLAKLGNLDQQTATNAMIALQNVYKLNTQQTADAVNYFGAVQKQTSLSMNDLVQAESRIGPIIEQLGGTYKDSATMVLAMKEAGVPAARSANALKSAMASIINPTSAATKEFEKFGINLTSIKDQQGPVNMILALQKAIDGIANPKDRQSLIDKLFGKYQFGNITALIENLGKAGSQTVNAMQVGQASSAQLAALANQEIKQATSSPSAQWQKALNTFKADLYPVGQMIMKIGTDLLSFGNRVAKVFSDLPGPVKTVLAVLLGFVAISGPIIMLTGLMANFAGNILKGVFNLKQLITGGKTLGQILTPEMIAAQNATDLFSKGLLGDVDAIKLLNDQIEILTNNLTNLVSKMGAGAGLPSITENLKTDVGAVLTTESAIASQLSLPGFAKGRLPGSHRSGGQHGSVGSGYHVSYFGVHAKHFAKGIVPGSGDGSVDTFPAMLAPGEAVIPADKTKKYNPVLQAIMYGNLPGFADGNRNMLERIHLTNDESGVLAFGTREFNQASKSGSHGNWPGAAPGSGVSGGEAADELRGMMSGNLQLPYVSELAKKVGASVEQTQKAINDALTKSIEEFDKSPNERFGGTNGKKVEDVTGKYIKQEFSKIPTTIVKKIDDTVQSQSLADVTNAIKVDRSSGRSGKTMYDPTLFDSITGKPISQMGLGSATSTASGGVASKLRLAQMYGIDPQLMANELSRQANTPTVKESATKSGQEIGKTLASSMNQGAKEAIQSASPSKVAEQLTIDYGDGLLIGGDQVIPKVQELGTKLGTTLSDANAQAIKESTPEVVSAAEVQAEEVSTSMLSKMKGLATSSGGLGIGAMIGGQFLSGKGGIVGAAGSALSNAGMASMAMPAISSVMGMVAPGLAVPGVGEVMAGVAAITLATKGISDLIKQEKTAQQQAQATFSSSSDVASFFGKTAANTADNLGKIGESYQKVGSDASSASNSMGVTNTQLQQFITMAKSLPSNNPLNEVLDRIKANPGNAAQIATAFTNMQIAIGNIDPSKAQSLYNLIMAATGQTGAATGLAGGIAAAAKAAMTGSSQSGSGSGFLSHWLHDVVEGPVLGEIFRAQGKNKNINAAQQNTFSQLTNAAINSGSLDQIQKTMQGISQAGVSGSKAIDLLTGSLSDASQKHLVDQLSQAGVAWQKIPEVLSVIGKGGSVDLRQGGAAIVAASEKFLKDSQNVANGGNISNSQTQALTNQINAINSSTAGYTAQVTAIKDQVKTLTDAKKVIDSQLAAQKLITSEMKAQMQYQQGQTDLAEQAKQAFISGDYLQAASIKQQMSFATLQYNQQGAQDKLQNKSDALTQQIADLNDKENQLQDAISNNTTAVGNLTTALGKAQAQANSNAQNPTQVTAPEIGKGGANTFTSVADATKQAAALGLKGSFLSNVNLDPSKWNNPFYSGFGNSVRQNIKAFAAKEGYTFDANSKVQTEFEIDHNGIAYVFKMTKGNNVEMVSSKPIPGYKNPQVTLPTTPSTLNPSFGLASSVATSTVTAQSGSTVFSQTLNFPNVKDSTSAAAIGTAVSTSTQGIINKNNVQGHKVSVVKPTGAATSRGSGK